MYYMFSGASAFNQPLNSWNVGSVTDMSRLFEGAYEFNQPLNDWNVSSVVGANSLFRSCFKFNQPLDKWNTSSMNTLYAMFQDAAAFNQPLNTWNTSNVTNMGNTFFGANSFNQPLDAWDTSKVTTMRQMFLMASSFNQPLNTWNTAMVTDLNAMFYYGSSFNQPLSNWDVSKVTRFQEMFQGAGSFNQDLSAWNTVSATNMIDMFSYATGFNNGHPAGETGTLTWDMSKVTSMEDMFYGAAAFNQSLDGWNTGLVANMNRMFSNASNFDQNIGSWNVSNVTTMTDILNGSGLSLANYDNLLAGWSARPVQPNISLAVGGLCYTERAARNVLTAAPNNWTITDGGFCPPTLISPANNTVLTTATPVFTGTAPVAGVTVTVEVNGQQYSAVSTAEKTYEVMATTPLPDGWHTVKVSSDGVITPVSVNFIVSTVDTGVRLSGNVSAPTLSWDASPTAPVGYLWDKVTSSAGWSVRGYYASAVYKDRLWVLGGDVGAGVDANDVWSSEDGVSWTQATASAQWAGREGHAATVFNGKLWVLGGCSGSPCVEYNDVWSSEDGVTWTQETASAGWSARSSPSVTVFNNKLWLVGGHGDAVSYNDVWSSEDGVTWTQETASAGWSARGAHTTAVFNNKLWLIGGCSDVDCGPDGDVWYSEDGVTWTEVTPTPSQATTRVSWSQPMAQVFDNKLWVIGGYNSDWDFTDEVWSTEDGVTWTLVTDNPGWGPKAEHTTAVFYNKLWVMGGNDGVLGRSNDVWSTDLVPTTTYTVCWDTTPGGCTYNAQTTTPTFTIPHTLASGAWYFSVRATGHGDIELDNYTATPYQVGTPPTTPVSLSLVPILHPITEQPFATTIAPALVNATLAIQSYQCTADQPSIARYATDGLQAPDAGVTLLGGIGFSMGCVYGGDVADIAITLATGYGDTSKLRAYKQSGSALVDITDQVKFATRYSNNTWQTVISYQLIDGSGLDEDGVANGTIVDPIFIGALPGAGEMLAATGVNSWLIAGMGGGALLGGVALVSRRYFLRSNHFARR